MCESGETLSGMYDGYGRISGVQVHSDYDSEESPTPTFLLEYDEDLEMEKQDGERDHVSLWHKDCWKAAGEPPYSGASENAPDQGYFFDDPDHDMECPWPNVERKLNEPKVEKEEGQLPPEG